jgi:DNA-binding SARP family transcriptional activator
MVLGEKVVQFRLLGTLEVWVANTRVTIASLRQRAVLAMLLLNNGHIVSVDRLIESVWSDSQPPTARTQIHICISHLRRLLSRVGVTSTIETATPGYCLHLGDASLDVIEFEDLLRMARWHADTGHWVRAAEVFDESLRLWRGNVLSGIEGPPIRRAALRLDERRTAALEEGIDAKIKADLRTGLISELIELVAEHPFREHFQAQLVLALCREGRKADALRAFTAARRRFVEELGLEPSERFRSLEQAILSGQLDPVAEIDSPELRAGQRHGQGLMTHFQVSA